MSTTTIRLPEELKARVAKLAKRSGVTTHSYILEAIAEKTHQEELRVGFHAVADERLANLVATGKTIPWQEMRGYLAERAAGKTTKRATSRKTAR